MSNTPGRAAKSPIAMNFAKAYELKRIPGIGDAKAQKIVEARREGHSMLSVDRMPNITGIPAKEWQDMLAKNEISFTADSRRSQRDGGEDENPQDSENEIALTTCTHGFIDPRKHEQDVRKEKERADDERHQYNRETKHKSEYFDSEIDRIKEENELAVIAIRSELVREKEQHEQEICFLKGKFHKYERTAVADFKELESENNSLRTEIKEAKAQRDEAMRDCSGAINELSIVSDENNQLRVAVNKLHVQLGERLSDLKSHRSQG